MTKQISRRGFVKSSMLASAALPLGWQAHAAAAADAAGGTSRVLQPRELAVAVRQALAAWLEQYRATHKEGPVWPGKEATFQEHFRELRKAAKVPSKPNGLRHGFCSFAYLVKGEDWTAKAAGHAPAMLITHYRGLHTEAEAKAWFAVKPADEPGNVVRLERKVGA